MNIEYFETQREFNLKFPSKFYICAFCSALTPYPDLCINCNTRADGFLKTMESGYKYQIKNQKPQEIFKPIELLEGESNAASDK